MNQGDQTGKMNGRTSDLPPGRHSGTIDHGVSGGTSDEKKDFFQCLDEGEPFYVPLPPPSPPVSARGCSPQYRALYDVLMHALRQAEQGKGKERHAEPGELFERQIICEVSRPGRAGIGGLIFQAVKKAYEAIRMVRQHQYDQYAKKAGAFVEAPPPPPGLYLDHARQELLGAINYLAAAVIVLDDYSRSGGDDGCLEEGTEEGRG